jgi:hypothetical protein
MHALGMWLIRVYIFVHTRAHICAHKFGAAVSAVAEIIWDGLGELAFAYA